MINTQKPMQPELDDAPLMVHSTFETIQGEGPYAGRPALFIRLAGCNLQCPMCDTVYTGEGVRSMTANAIARLFAHVRDETPIGLVVFTGGEPFRQDLRLVTEMAGAFGLVSQVETNGTLRPRCSADTAIVVSPKAPKVNPFIEEQARWWKFVIDADNVDPSDMLPTLALGGMRPARPPRSVPPSHIYVQPMDVDNPVENTRHIAAAVEACRTMGYTMCLQTHKILNLP